MSQPSTNADAGFPQFTLDPSVQRGIAALGFTEPRPIQAKTLPAAHAGRDVLGLAQTGTGKTAAFALPIIQRLLGTAARRPGPRALIVAPTRELAMQIHTEFSALAKFTGLKAVTIFGGVSQGQQVRALRGRPEILIACPGRLLDLMQQGEVFLGGVEVLVLDEADHMFDMGFLPDIRRIVKTLPPGRQSLLFSATMPDEIRALTNSVLRDPHVVELEHATPLATIEHTLYNVEQGGKVALLQHLLAEDGFRSAIVFSRTKQRARRLALQLSRGGHNAIALQGNMSQAQRDRAMEGFRKGEFDVLVATDIAARGIDVANISHVINFDIPSTPDAYTHRIGRTGRAERTGKAYTFASPEDLATVRAIEHKLGSRIARKQAPGFEGRTILPARTARPAAREHVQDGVPRQDSRRGRNGNWRGPRNQQASGGSGTGQGNLRRTRRGSAPRASAPRAS